MAKTLITTTLIAFLASPALAVTPGPAEEWPVKTYMPVDPAGSKGSQSLAIGFGSVMGGTANQRPDESNSSPKHQQDPIFRLHMTKGLSVPLDIGMILGTSPDGLTQQAGAHLQWTAFEGFRLPAVSVRGAMMRTFLNRTFESDEDTHIQKIHDETRSLEIVGSWGILGILTPYAGAGQIITPHDTSFQKLAGLEVQIMPPFARLSLEMRSAFGSETLAAKVSLGL